MRQWFVLAGFVALCLSVGAVAGLVTAPAVAEWYPTLVKPSWRPPNWLFAPAWTLLYILMAIAAWLVWKTGGARIALLLWSGQLLLNLAWSFLFFGARSPGLGLLDMCWVSFALALNASIFMLN
jgi:translocator protein